MKVFVCEKRGMLTCGQLRLQKLLGTLNILTLDLTVDTSVYTTVVRCLVLLTLTSCTPQCSLFIAFSWGSFIYTSNIVQMVFICEGLPC